MYIYLRGGSVTFVGGGATSADRNSNAQIFGRLLSFSAVQVKGSTLCIHILTFVYVVIHINIFIFTHMYVYMHISSPLGNSTRNALDICSDSAQCRYRASSV